MNNSSEGEPRGPVGRKYKIMEEAGLLGPHLEPSRIWGEGNPRSLQGWLSESSYEQPTNNSAGNNLEAELIETISRGRSNWKREAVVYTSFFGGILGAVAASQIDFIASNSALWLGAFTASMAGGMGTAVSIMRKIEAAQNEF